MVSVYGAKYCSLHVRESNRAALGMYADVLKYEIVDLEYEYYADKEHAYDMCLFFDLACRESVIKHCKKDHAKRKADKLKEANKAAGIVDDAEESKETEDSGSQTPMSKSQKKKQNKKKNK